MPKHRYNRLLLPLECHSDPLFHSREIKLQVHFKENFSNSKSKSHVMHKLFSSFRRIKQTRVCGIVSVCTVIIMLMYGSKQRKNLLLSVLSCNNFESNCKQANRACLLSKQSWTLPEHKTHRNYKQVRRSFTKSLCACQGYCVDS
jgi:hypothetical protein